jgi:hypothetical protein
MFVFSFMEGSRPQGLAPHFAHWPCYESGLPSGLVFAPCRLVQGQHVFRRDLSDAADTRHWLFGGRRGFRRFRRPGDEGRCPNMRTIGQMRMIDRGHDPKRFKAST